jgi:superfamily II DNA or RNA helicase
LQLEAIFGAIISDIPASYLIERGHLVAPIIRIRKVPPQRYTKDTKYPTVYDDYVVGNERRNALIVDDAASKIRRGLPTLTLVRIVNHGAALSDSLSRKLGFTVPFLSGKDDSTTRRSVIRDLRSGTCRAVVATTIADEGLDIKPLAGLVLGASGKSSTRALQRIGRVLRPYSGKTHAEVTDFEDNAKYLYDHTRRRVKIYESEPSFILTDL